MRFNYEGDYTETFIGDLIIQKGKRAKGRELEYKAYSINNQTGFSIQEEQWGDASYTKLEKNGYKVIENNDLAYNPARINVGSVGLYKEQTPCIVSSLYVCFATKPKLSPDYLFKYLKSEKFNKKVLSTQEGGVRTYFFYDKLQKTKMFIPTLSEQKKVNDFLDCINGRIDTQNKIIKELETYKSAIEDMIFKSINFPLFAIGDLCKIVTGKLDANAAVPGGMYRFYTCAANYTYIDKYAFDCDAVLISGNGANVGYVHQYNGKFNAYQRTYVLYDFTNVTSTYLRFFLEKYLKQRINSEKNNGNTPYIRLETISKMKIGVPDQNKQNLIVNALLAITSKIDNEQKLLENFYNQKRFLLANLFI